MRHLKRNAKLGRKGEHRNAMLANLVCSLIKSWKGGKCVTTTLAKAKAARPVAEKLVTLGKKGSIHHRRLAAARLKQQARTHFKGRLKGQNPVSGKELREAWRENEDVVRILFDEIATEFKERPGGYTRIVKLGNRRLGDGTDLVMLELVGREEGSQVSGSGSRRRRIAQGRTAYASQLLGGGASATAVADDAETTAPEAVTEVAELAPETPETPAAASETAKGAAPAAELPLREYLAGLLQRVVLFGVPIASFAGAVRLLRRSDGVESRMPPGTDIGELVEQVGDFLMHFLGLADHQAEVGLKGHDRSLATNRVPTCRGHGLLDQINQ